MGRTVRCEGDLMCSSCVIFRLLAHGNCCLDVTRMPNDEKRSRCSVPAAMSRAFLDIRGLLNLSVHSRCSENNTSKA